jgi:hypothetical protein
MTPTVDLTETIIFASLRALLQTMLAPTVEVIKAQANRVPEPVGADFVLMTPLLRNRLSTNIDTYQDPLAPLEGTGSIQQRVRFDVQLDVHGPHSDENVHVITTLWRDEYTTSYFDAGPNDMQALYADDPRQVPFVNAEQQWENRWVTTLSMQVNPIVTVEQDFADAVHVGIVEVDTTYGP